MSKDSIVWSVYNGECGDCRAPIAATSERRDEWPHWSFHFAGQATKKHPGGVTHLFAVCAGCATTEMSMREAAVEGRRFTRIAVADRCHCGAVLMSFTSKPRELCVRCWREDRMLSLAHRDAMRALRTIREINRMVKGVA